MGFSIVVTRNTCIITIKTVTTAVYFVPMRTCFLILRPRFRSKEPGTRVVTKCSRVMGCMGLWFIVTEWNVHILLLVLSCDSPRIPVFRKSSGSHTGVPVHSQREAVVRCTHRHSVIQSKSPPRFNICALMRFQLHADSFVGKPAFACPSPLELPASFEEFGSGLLVWYTTSKESLCLVSNLILDRRLYLLVSPLFFFKSNILRAWSFLLWGDMVV